MAADAVVAADRPGTVWRLLGALLFLVGVFLVTVLVNVPLNNALAALDLGSRQGKEFWERYRVRWTRWNHVRALAAVAAATSLTVGFGWC